MSKQEINEYVKSKEISKEYKNEILTLSDRIKDGESSDNVHVDICSKIKNDNFLELIFSDLNNSLQPFYETEFLRNLEITDFEKFINIVFENGILRLSSIKQVQSIVDISVENLKCIVKFLNYSKYQIITKRYSKELFITTTYDMFRLNRNYAEVVWNLFDNNRNDLIISVLMDNSDMIRDIKNSVYMILNIFEDIIEDK